jgi:eukaryotic-like serine/threonine-protein kinase
MALPGKGRQSIRGRLRDGWRWLAPALTNRHFVLGLLLAVVALATLIVAFNHIMMPAYTRQDAQVTVPEVRELSYDEAVRMIEGRRLRAERREQPFNPGFPRDAIIDQNPGPNALVKPGRRIYLYVNSGTERTVSMPEVRTLTESVARSQLAELGLVQVSLRRDERPSPYPGTVTLQEPSAGEAIRTGESVTLWISPGLGDGAVEVPDVRGLGAEEAAERLSTVGLWVDPTRAISGTVTRQEPFSGSTVRPGTEVRLSSVPIEDEPDVIEPLDYPEGMPPSVEDVAEDPVPAPTPRDADRTDW